jgi:alcohol dehydrogenase
MKALAYLGEKQRGLVDKEKPKLIESTDVILKMLATTICGSDLHILAGHTPEVPVGLTIGHEGVGVVEEVGSAVLNFRVGDRVIISCVTSCGTCYYCKKGVFAHCEKGGWILGHHENGTQAEYVRIPLADNSLFHAPDDIDSAALAMLSDIFPTGLEIGAMAGKVEPGCSVAIVGAGPIGMSVLLAAQFFSPAKIIMIDLNNERLSRAMELGATHAVNSSNEIEALIKIYALTEGRGVDVAVEAVGAPTTFELCQKIIAPCGRIANVGVHGRSATIFLERLWTKNINISTGLVCCGTTPMLIKTVEAGRVKPELLISHKFKFNEIIDAYDAFENPQKSGAMKVAIEF